MADAAQAAENGAIALATGNPDLGFGAIHDQRFGANTLRVGPPMLPTVQQQTRSYNSREFAAAVDSLVLISDPANMNGVPFTNFGIFGAKGTQFHGEEPYKYGGARVTSNDRYATAFAHLTKWSQLRNQAFEANTARGIKWENEAGGQPAMHYTFFPVARVRKTARPEEHEVVEMSSFVVFYTNFELQQGRMCAHKPMYLQHTTQRGAVVNVDMALASQTDSRLAIVSALESADPQRGWYLTFVPYEPIEHQMAYMRLAAPNRESFLEKPAYYQLNGASLGAATVQAILGGPPVHYTGFQKSIMGPNTALNKLGPEYGGFDWRPERADRMANPGDQAAFQKVSHSVALIAEVSLVAFKIDYCVAYNVPFVVPSNNIYGQNLAHLLSDPAVRQRILSQFPVLRFQSGVYTMAQVENGIPYMAHKTPIFMAATISDMSILSAIAYLAYYVEGGPANYEYGSLEALQGTWDNVALPVLSEKVNRGLHEAAENAARAKQRRAELKPLPYPEKVAKKQQWRTEAATQKAQTSLATARERAAKREQQIDATRAKRIANAPKGVSKKKTALLQTSGFRSVVQQEEALRAQRRAERERTHERRMAGAHHPGRSTAEGNSATDSRTCHRCTSSESGRPEVTRTVAPNPSPVDCAGQLHFEPMNALTLGEIADENLRERS